MGAANAQTSFTADGKINVFSTIITASNTASVVTTRPATVYGVDVSNTNGTIAFLKLYNAATATCGSGTPVARYLIPATISGAATSYSNTNGDAYVNGLTICVVTGISDGNTVAPAAGAGTVNIHWKNSVSP